MKCIICKVGTTMPGKTTITLERDNMTLVFKGVPDHPSAGRQATLTKPINQFNKLNQSNGYNERYSN